MSDQRIFNFSKKLFFHPERIVAYKQGERPFPVTMEIDLTDNCNHKCVWCYDLDKHRGVNSPFLETTVIKKTLKEAYALGTRGINFSGGGEPMLHRDFVEIVRFCKDTGFDVGVISNGSVISRKNARELCGLLSWIRISMAGGDRASYEEIQGVDQFDLVIRNVKFLSDVKLEIGSNLAIGIRVLVLEKNLHTLENMAHILRGMHINYLQLAPDQFSTDGGRFWNGSDSQSMQAVVSEILKPSGTALLKAGFSVAPEKLVSIAGANPNQPIAPNPLDYPTTCYAHFFQAVITARGELRFCKNSRGDDRYILGNIRENSLKEIWDGDTNRGIEGWVRPNNCGLLCKNMDLNTSMEDILHPDSSVFPNFVN